MTGSVLAGLLAATAMGCVGWFTRPNLARRRARENLFAAGLPNFAGSRPGGAGLSRDGAGLSRAGAGPNGAGPNGASPNGTAPAGGSRVNGTRASTARASTVQANTAQANTAQANTVQANKGLSNRAAYQLAVELSTIIDIVAVGVSSGLSVLAALQLAARDGPEHLGRRLAEVLADDDLSLADSLDQFGHYCGPRARPFVQVLASSIRYGIELAPALERIQYDLREETRRRIEKRVRQLPVLMLFPLVFCVLPALGWVGVVPVLVAAFQL